MDYTAKGGHRAEILVSYEQSNGLFIGGPAVKGVTFVTVYDQTSCVAECALFKRSRTFSNFIAVVYGELGSKVFFCSLTKTFSKSLLNSKQQSPPSSSHITVALVRLGKVL